MTLQETLQTHAFTEGLDDRALVSLTSLAHEVTFAEGELVLENDRYSEFFYLVVSGSVTIQLHTPRVTVSVQAVGPGEAFGWSSLLDYQDTLFQVRAREQTTALRISGTALKDLCRTDPAAGTEILLRLLKVVAGRVKATEARFAEMCGVRVSRTGSINARVGTLTTIGIR
ncbi:MAG: cyclic nucleotide-binding domain-containing protein [Bryobacteraceae bacterium]